MKRTYTSYRSGGSRSGGSTSARRTVRARTSARPTTTAGFRSQGQRRAMANINRPERKVTDNNQAVVINDIPTVELLNGVATGDSFDNRDGRKIVLKSIFIRGHVLPQDPQYTQPQHCRIMIVQDMQNNSVAAETNSTTSQTFAALVLKTGTESISNLNMQNAGRFKVLRDTEFVIGKQNYTGAAGAAASGGGVYKYKKYLKVNIPVHYSGTGSTGASIMDNAIYVLTIGSADNTGTGGMAFNFESRVRFVDV